MNLFNFCGEETTPDKMYANLQTNTCIFKKLLKSDTFSYPSDMLLQFATWYSQSEVILRGRTRRCVTYFVLKKKHRNGTNNFNLVAIHVFVEYFTKAIYFGILFHQM